MILKLKRPVSYWRAQAGRGTNAHTGRAYPHVYRLYNTEGTICMTNGRWKPLSDWHSTHWTVKHMLERHWTIVSPVGDIRVPEGL